MRFILFFVLALIPLTACFSLQAQIPEEMVRQMARKDGVDLGAICSFNGKSYSEGAIACMETERMVCSEGDRWVRDGTCTPEESAALARIDRQAPSW